MTPKPPELHVPSFIWATIVFVIIASILFGTYYFLIARPKIKANCINAATTAVIIGENQSGLFNDGITVNKGEEVKFNQTLYDECVKIF